MYGGFVLILPAIWLVTGLDIPKSPLSPIGFAELSARVERDLHGINRRWAVC